MTMRVAIDETTSRTAALAHVIVRLRMIERVSVTFFLFLFLFLLQQTRVPKRVDSDIRLFHSMMMEIHLHPTHCLGGVKCCRKIILVLFRWSGGVASSNRHTRDATVTRVGKIQYFGVEFAFVRNRSLAPYNDHPAMNGSSVFSSLTHTHSRQASTCYNTWSARRTTHYYPDRQCVCVCVDATLKLNTSTRDYWPLRLIMFGRVRDDVCPTSCHRIFLNLDNRTMFLYLYLLGLLFFCLLLLIFLEAKINSRTTFVE